MTETLRIANQDIELFLVPSVGGSVAVFRWRGQDMLRAGDPADGPLALGSFPLVPFSNRIADGRFAAHDKAVQLAANHVQDGKALTTHGFGWQAAWDAVEHTPDSALLLHRYSADDWPWSYCAEQRFTLTGDGFVHQLTLRNDGSTPMPCGLGIHPYFPRSGARLDLDIGGRWEADDDGLPTRQTPLADPPEWFGAAPIDHIFTGRSRPISISWPDRRLTLSPDPELAFTVVYVPEGADYFCVEPVSHLTNAVNRLESPNETGLKWLEPGKSWSVSIAFAVAAVQVP